MTILTQRYRNKPKVTILVPTYNHEEFLYACLTSVEKQIFKDWEAVIINDGSTDKTEEIAKEFTAKDKRFKLISQQNTGIQNLAKNCNKVLKKHPAKIVAFIEGDDLWDQKYLWEVNEAFTRSSFSPSAIFTNGYRLNEDGSTDKLKVFRNALTKYFFTSCPQLCNAFIILNFRAFEMPSCCVAYNGSALTNIGGFYQPNDVKWFDKPTWILLAKSGNFNFHNGFLGFWRQHQGQMTKNLPKSFKYTADGMYQDRQLEKRLRLICLFSSIIFRIKMLFK